MKYLSSFYGTTSTSFYGTKKTHTRTHTHTHQKNPPFSRFRGADSHHNNPSSPPPPPLPTSQPPSPLSHSPQHFHYPIPTTNPFTTTHFWPKSTTRISLSKCKKLWPMAQNLSVWRFSSTWTAVQWRNNKSKPKRLPLNVLTNALPHSPPLTWTLLKRSALRNALGAKWQPNYVSNNAFKKNHNGDREHRNSPVSKVGGLGAGMGPKWWAKGRWLLDSFPNYQLQIRLLPLGRGWGWVFTICEYSCGMGLDVGNGLGWWVLSAGA